MPEEATPNQQTPPREGTKLCTPFQRQEGKTPCAAGDVPGFADAAVFCMIYDDQLLHGTYDLTPYPALKALYEGVSTNPGVADWVSKTAAESAAMKAAK